MRENFPVWQELQGKVPRTSVDQSSEEYHCLRMGMGGHRPPKLENLLCVYNVKLNPFSPKVSLFVQKGLKYLVMVKNVPKLNQYILQIYTMCSYFLF